MCTNKKICLVKKPNVIVLNLKNLLFHILNLLVFAQVILILILFFLVDFCFSKIDCEHGHNDEDDVLHQLAVNSNSKPCQILDVKIFFFSRNVIIEILII